ncbi:hypothetical protein Lalb_Chr22g0360221 [Lupinus albus]|uniref:Uncharacterized protein n=1 Tax=Lupinus albus TaxID=3870 RepID=A0A6A4NDL2_LUPAL|nr:hypothetical protein Lalb_Chr22g0360221 [Lupinus albus]
MEEFEVEFEETIELFVDNKSAINLAKNPIAHGRSKHREKVSLSKRSSWKRKNQLEALQDRFASCRHYDKGFEG